MLSIERPEQLGTYRQINLGPDHDAAIDRWHRIEAGLETSASTSRLTDAISGTGDSILIGELVDVFLTSQQTRIKLGTLDGDRYRITRHHLLKFVESFGGLPVGSLRVGGVTRIENWLAQQKTWFGCRPDVIKRIKHLFNWATVEGYISSSPIKALKKGKYGQRVNTFTPEQEAAILAASNSFFATGFKMLLMTGCRPNEICSLESKQFHEGNHNSLPHLVVDHKTQRYTGKPRKVFLVEEAAEIVRALIDQYPKGRLFRSGVKTSKAEWRPMSIEYFCHAFRNICRRPECEKLGLNTYKKFGKRRLYDYVPYTARHTFALRWLTGYHKDKNGSPIILNYGEVAVLMGNSAAEVERTYGHLCDQTKFLSDRLRGTFGQ